MLTLKILIVNSQVYIRVLSFPDFMDISIVHNRHFFLSISWGRWMGDLPQEDLTKFG
jgi:hypothetical protein